MSIDDWASLISKTGGGEEGSLGVETGIQNGNNPDDLLNTARLPDTSVWYKAL